MSRRRLATSMPRHVTFVTHRDNMTRGAAIAQRPAARQNDFRAVKKKRARPLDVPSGTDHCLAIGRRLHLVWHYRGPAEFLVGLSVGADNTVLAALPVL
jgi:hypothetical protein